MAWRRPAQFRLLTSKLLASIVLGFALLSHDVYEEGTLVELALNTAAFLLLFGAALGRNWTSAYISGRKNAVLVRDGPYSMVRNPLYFFSFLGYLGAGLAFKSVVIAIAMAVAFFVTHWGTILAEERRLRRAFGAEFDDYSRRVPRFLPRPWLLMNPVQIPLAPAKFSRATVESALIPLVLGLALVVEWCHVNAVIPVVFRLH